MKKSCGFTLMEILISTIILSVIFLGVTTLYVSGGKFFKSSEKKETRAGMFTAIEFMERRIALGNFVQVDSISQTGDQVKVRWDYGTDFNDPLPLGINDTNADGIDDDMGTPSDTSDDYWIKFRIIGGRLRYRVDSTSTADVAASDAEVVPGLPIKHLDGATIKSKFILTGAVVSIELLYDETGDDTAVYTRIAPRALTV